MKDSIKDEHSPAKPKTSSHGSIPYGREAVKEAILDATEKLLITRSSSEITVREIAKAANIKHPLIHRHFGTKNSLILEVYARSLKRMDKVTSKIDAIAGNIGTILQVVKKDKAQRLVLARAMIEGLSPHQVQNQFPVIRTITQLMQKHQDESKNEKKFDPKILTGVITATSLGWILYEPFLLAALELEDENKDEIQGKMVEILEEIVQRLC